MTSKKERPGREDRGTQNQHVILPSDGKAVNWRQIEAIKRELGAVPELLRRHGVQVQGTAFRCFLPGHEDRHSSGSIFANGTRWRCHTCHRGGDVLDAYAELKRMTIKEAIRQPTADSDAATKAPRTAEKRLRLPPVHEGSPADHEALGELRNVSTEAIGMLVDRGLLRFADLKGHRAWLVLDSTRRNAQARRLDGGLWEHIGDKKAWTLPGSKAAWPIGLVGAKAFPAIVLLEGGPDMLGAAVFIIAEDAQERVAPVCITGSGPIPKSSMPYFTGKRVRLFPHADEPGQNTGAKWSAQLKRRGVDVDCFSFEGLRQVDGSPVGDLNDLAYIRADDFEDDRELWGVMP
jgi:hypothetical protein